MKPALRKKNEAGLRDIRAGRTMSLSDYLASMGKRIDARLTEGLEDVKKGQVYGPFRSARKMARALYRKQKPKKA
jgi:hypothetical protein